MLTLASLAKGNALFGSPIPGIESSTNVGCVPLIHRTNWVSNIAISDWYIGSDTPGPDDEGGAIGDPSTANVKL